MQDLVTREYSFLSPNTNNIWKKKLLMQKTCPKCEPIYNTEKYQFCPKCQQEYDFNNGPWKEN